MRQVLREDSRGYRQAWHQDIDDLERSYMGQPGCTLYVARLDGRVVGTSAVRPCALRTPPNPGWLAHRYNRPEVSEPVRVWVHSSGRRHGAARLLVRKTVSWAVTVGGYQTVYLHTDTSAPGAKVFWRSLPTVEVFDARPDPHNCVHSEVDVEKLLTLSAAQ